MVPAVAGHIRARCGHDDEIEVGDDEDELTAVPPRIERFVTAEAADPESVTVLPVAAPPRSPHAIVRFFDPVARNQLAIAAAAAVFIQLAEPNHLARRHEHVVAAEIDALRILRPLRQCEPKRLGELLLRELPRTGLRRL